MKLYVLKRTQQLSMSIDEAWSFFSNPNNLPDITPPWMKFKVKSERPDAIYPGMMATYRLQPVLGVTLNWVTEITHMVEGSHFVDEQRFGPYRFWHHLHQFRENKNGVEMADTVHYALPFGPFGRLAHKLTVQKKLDQIFEYRHKKLNELFFAKE